MSFLLSFLNSPPFSSFFLPPPSQFSHPPPGLPPSLTPTLPLLSPPPFPFSHPHPSPSLTPTLPFSLPTLLPSLIPPFPLRGGGTCDNLGGGGGGGGGCKNLMNGKHSILGSWNFMWGGGGEKANLGGGGQKASGGPWPPAPLAGSSAYAPSSLPLPHLFLLHGSLCAKPI